MSAQAAPAPSGPPTLTIGSRTYPVLLPKLRDPRLHLAATIISLQVIGQIGFHFRVSIAQILVAIGTCAVLEVGIAMRKQHVLMWPASAMLTGNGVAFILRVPGTQHGDWWSMRGWWIFAGTSAVGLLSKYVIQIRGAHIFNPSNIGLVLCFLLLGRARAEPLDFWWGPMSWWLVLALAVILAGGFAILSRLSLLRVALSFWVSFAIGIGILALVGHQMVARWHLGPVQGFQFWWILVTSPEILVFLFFMITDPRTAPKGPYARVVYAVGIGVVACLLIAPMRTEYATKVALLSALAVVCLVKPFAERAAQANLRRPVLALAVPVAAAGYLVLLFVLNAPATSTAAPIAVTGKLPPFEILPSRGVQSQLTNPIAREIENGLVSSPGVQVAADDHVKLWLERGQGQSPPVAVARTTNATYRLVQSGSGWSLASGSQPAPVDVAPSGPVVKGLRLANVAPSAGLTFRQGSFRFGMSNDYRAMMGGGVCWLDYNGDGWIDLFAVNSYASDDTTSWQAHGGLPTSSLFENDHGTFHDVSKQTHADLAVQGDGCVAGDLNGDGRPDLVVTTTSGVKVLWNDGNGSFTAADLKSSGWYTGATLADVNGDGRPDLFVAGYADPNEPVPNSLAGFPTNLAGVRDLLFLNEGDRRFREVGVQAGLENADPRHGLGAVFTDVNGDGRPDLYVANDEDPNQLYVNVPWPGGAAADPAGLGFRFEERAASAGVADAFAGMGIAAQDGLGLFVTNSRHEPSAAFRQTRGGTSPSFVNARPSFDPALGSGFAGWGVSWVDLANTGRPDLVLTAGAIPVTSLARDAEPVRVLAPLPGRAARYGDAQGALGPSGLRLNGRGLAAADVDNDGRMEVAVNTIGGKLVLLRPSGRSGHWLDVALARFSPGAVVTVTLPDGRRLQREVQAGSSYLSSEDPRLHFGLGGATTVRSVTVRYPWGGSRTLHNVHADGILNLPGASQTVPRRTAGVASGCTPVRTGDSIATLWDRTAVAVLRAGGASGPVQARDLFHLSAAMWDAWAAYDPGARGYFLDTNAKATDVARARTAAISYAAYRLLVWRASFNANLARTFALLDQRMRSLCYSPAFTGTRGNSPAALGNRIAAAAIAYGNHDGSLEAEHYVDSTYVPQNQPLIVQQPGTTVHDATFWQPLALQLKSAAGLAPVPAVVQQFEDAQWGHVRPFARVRHAGQGAPPLGTPSDRTYQRAAVAVIRATSRPHSALPGTSPADWNVLGESLGGGLRQDLRRYFTLNAALSDAAVATWRAKRAYQSPRPISMIRYLAFQGQSTDPKKPSFNREGLPLVPGLIELRNGKVMVLSSGRWILGARWTPPAQTPASPGWVSESSAFAYAADAALSALTGRSYDRQAQQAAESGLAEGIQIPADVTAGRAVGRAAGEQAVAAARRY
jgi:Na+-translocating ferredoxin:NAD+ oxidoreductase RnfD subunit